MNQIETCIRNGVALLSITTTQTPPPLETKIPKHVTAKVGSYQPHPTLMKQPSRPLGSLSTYQATAAFALQHATTRLATLTVLALRMLRKLRSHTRRAVTVLARGELVRMAIGAGIGTVGGFTGVTLDEHGGAGVVAAAVGVVPLFTHGS